MSEERMDVNGISLRLANVEKSNRRLKYTLDTVLAGFCLLFLCQTRPRAVAAQNKNSQVIEAQELKIKDAAGNVRVQIRANEEAAGLTLYTSDGQRRIAILGGPSSGLTIEGSDGKKIGIILTKEGPSLGFYDRQEVVRVFLAVTGDGPSVSLYDPKGIAWGSISLAKDGPSVSLFDREGRRRSSLGLTLSGSGLVFLDPNGQPLASLGTTQNAPVLALFDSKGNLLTHLP